MLYHNDSTVSSCIVFWVSFHCQYCKIAFCDKGFCYTGSQSIPNSCSMTKKKKPGGFLCSLEPDNLQWVHEFPRSTKMMRDVGWFPFCKIFQGHNVHVTREFVKNYKDSVVWFEYL